MLFDYENKTIQVKIVYYGPAMSGKTLSIKSLFSHYHKENEISSIENTLGRTLLYDFGVLEFNGSWNLKFLIYSATGQDFYAITRPVTLNEVDGIILVLDSRKSHLHYNVKSWNELEIMFGNNIYQIPIVLSFNKDDITDSEKLDIDEFLQNINHDSIKKFSLTKTSAIKGLGIMEAFRKLVDLIFTNFTSSNIKDFVINKESSEEIPSEHKKREEFDPQKAMAFKRILQSKGIPSLLKVFKIYLELYDENDEDLLDYLEIRYIDETYSIEETVGGNIFEWFPDIYENFAELKSEEELLSFLSNRIDEGYFCTVYLTPVDCININY